MPAVVFRMLRQCPEPFTVVVEGYAQGETFRTSLEASLYSCDRHADESAAYLRDVMGLQVYELRNSPVATANGGRTFPCGRLSDWGATRRATESLETPEDPS